MHKDLTEYNFPEELKNMSESELDLLAVQIREFLVEKVSRTGGHLASNLGVVELTIALHKAFTSPRDKIIWDVGHQCYVHKILTGRAGDFAGLRTFGGMSGFPKRRESIHDVYDTGHSSTSLSAAYGLAVSRDLTGGEGEVIAVIGDGSLTGGIAYEALNNIGSSGSKVIVILNDNGMSISKNTGSISQHLGNLRTSSGYQNAKEKLKNTLDDIPKIGKGLTRFLSETKDWVKYLMVSGGVLFEELGFTYLGPVNGHCLEDLLPVLEQARNAKGPVLVHVITKKGKGYRPAEKDPNKFHGIAPFDPETGELLKKSGPGYGDVMGRKLTAMARENQRITAISAAMISATGLERFQEVFPERLFDAGIAEAHAVSFAAGMAIGGLRPFVAIYSSFLQRAYDQIIEDVCLQELPVVFLVDRAGIVGADGETHHGIFDISYFRSFPGMTLLAPACAEELTAMMDYACSLGKPCAIRYPRGSAPFKEEEKPFRGPSVSLAEGKDAVLLAVGPMADTALGAREILMNKGIDLGVIKISIVDPELIPELPPDIPVFTLEDGALSGGFGEGAARCLKERRVIPFAWPDCFVEHGSPEELYRKYKLDKEGIAERIAEEIEGKA